ncbi:mitochondrial translation release factor in rescue [Ischnura elegans]|uniref:mitochondrial translation release factor in rescue n=1 Tax=Ischnura elegans TaxID=197161 RepID=UPI001ED8B5E1|nr:mitochondrial translation release factor in rescue [Ischnura elegans]
MLTIPRLSRLTLIPAISCDPMVSGWLSLRSKHTVDYSLVPKVKEEDLKEQFVRGSGPGGQSVNKTSNCVVLTHTPTGIVVRCHQSRSLDQNRRIARELLVTKLDNLQNGAKSVEAQLKSIRDAKSIKKDQKKRKIASLKEQWKNMNSD